MEEYLKSTLDKLKTKYYAELDLVMGNESCDLDSAVSAIVYATFLYWQYDKIKCCKVCTRFNREEVAYKEGIYLPILNVSRQDYVLKTEVVHCLNQAGIDAENLVFRDDYNLQELIKDTPTKVTLVDHHVMAKNDQFLTPYVTEIIDHRPLDKSQWGYKEDTRTTIAVVGSCCTLVAQRIKDLSALVATDTEFFETYKICCDMLHSTIILDTVNFSKEVNKATPHDEEMVLFLESILKPGDVLADRAKKLDGLLKARSDVSSLTAAELLRKDVKMLGYMLVPSFPILVKEFLSRPLAVEVVSEALKRAGCSIVLLLGMDLRNGLKRDLALWGEDTKRVDKLVNMLQELQPSLDLLEDKLANKSDSKLDGFRYFVQRNLGASRKQYVPAVMRFLNEIK